MSNVLAALFGGLGAGAQSYGASRMREQDQERMAAQRMTELQQQEQTRLATAREAAMLRQQQLKEEGEQAAVIARTLGIELPAGARLNTQGVQVLAQDAANKRAAAAQAGATERTGMTTQAAMDRLERQIAANAGLSSAREAAAYAQAAAANARASQMGNQPAVDTRKPLLSTDRNKLNEMADVLRAVQGAKEGLSQPGADKHIGRKNLVLNTLLPASLENAAKDYFDPEGTAVRARVANLFSAIGKARSGGAITTQEFERLMRFLPGDDMPVNAAMARLNELENEYTGMVQTRLDQLGSTYQTPTMEMLTRRQQAPAAPSAPTAAPARLPGETPAQYMARIKGGR